MAERFQPRTLASFNKHQIEQVFLWAHRNDVTKAKDSGQTFVDAFSQAIQTAELDEKGKPMNERGRERLQLASKVFVAFGKNQVDFVDLKGDVTVWQISKDPERIEVRWNVADPRYPISLGRTFERHQPH